MEVDAEVLQDMVAYIEKSQELLEKAASVENSISEQAPSVVDSLIKAGLLDSEQRQLALVRIQDPLKALESLKKTAEAYRKPVVTTSLGTPGEIKSAGVSREGSAPKEKESDRIWNQSFGG
jgi:hypothetical protein